MDLAFRIDNEFGFEQIRLTVKHGAENVVDKLVAALKDGRLPGGPYVSDWEFDDDGVVWMNTELVVDGVWHGIGADESNGELIITRGLDSDGLDYTAAPIRDVDHYWMAFLNPLKQILAILN